MKDIATDLRDVLSFQLHPPNTHTLTSIYIQEVQFLFWSKMPRALVCVDYLLKNKNLSETQYTKIFIIQQILKSMNEISLLAQNMPILSTIGIDNRRQKKCIFEAGKMAQQFKNIGCSSRGPKFYYQLPCGHSQPSVTPVPGI